ncbi:MAG TPA: hypothetical protein PK854_07500 [Oscillospiraceae bacterium]|nr:hypothetical protein [Oscillospiraceae bacterium]HPS35095.1 hypothetical protein [Oscillospiraceae bacterium]
MVKRFICILVVIIFFAFPLTLHADMVLGNDFFYENEDKTEDRGGNFIINSPSGYVIPSDEPGSGKAISSNKAYKWNIYGQVFETWEYGIFVFENGKYCAIDAIYLYNGEYWGLMYPYHGYQPPGWVLMDDLSMIYQNEDFEKENKDSIYEYSSSFDASSIEKLVLWKWPGSDREECIIDDEYTVKSFAEDVDFAYKDSEGREWGKIRAYWVCLSDPENKTNIPSFNPARNPIKWSYDGIRDWTQEAIVWPSAEPTAEAIAVARNGKQPLILRKSPQQRAR